ncbi:MAG: hypothetical protein LBQ47_06535, partial [Endomicrobium sp.]|nr:hypothetical protein [Endomicrobium sp.]
RVFLSGDSCLLKKSFYILFILLQINQIETLNAAKIPKNIRRVFAVNPFMNLTHPFFYFSL